MGPSRLMIFNPLDTTSRQTDNHGLHNPTMGYTVERSLIKCPKPPKRLLSSPSYVPIPTLAENDQMLKGLTKEDPASLAQDPSP